MMNTPNNLDRRPIPDPTLLTTEQLKREIAGLKELLEARIDALALTLKVSIDDSQKFPALSLSNVGQLREVHDERFRNVQAQFSERDLRVERALDAAKEIVKIQNDNNENARDKMETSFTKQFDTFNNIIHALAKSNDEKIADLKTRLDRGEGGAKASDRTADRSSVVLAQIIAASVAVVVIGGALVSVIVFILSRGS